MGHESEANLPGYVYVATCPELIMEGISKVGFSTNIRTRMKAHRSNSSTPYDLFCFQCFRFDNLRDARRVENWVKAELHKIGLGYESHSSEFFQMEPNRLADAIREGIATLKVSAIEDFPSDFEMALEKSGDFVSLPLELLQCLEAGEQKAYWHGARDALWTLWRLGKISCSDRDYLELHRLLEFNQANSEPMLCETFAMYFRNHNVGELREAGARLTSEIKEHAENGFSRIPGEFSIGEWRVEISKKKS
jgi:hypothetical protein